MPKKNAKNSKDAYPALNKKKNLRRRAKQLDYDYLNKLSPEELQWLNDFTEEYTHVNLKQDNARKKNNILDIEKDKKELYHKNYSQQNDIQTLLETCAFLTQHEIENLTDYLTEDQLVALIDYRLGHPLPRIPRKKRKRRA